jgi:hypothetical protein
MTVLGSRFFIGYQLIIGFIRKYFTDAFAIANCKIPVNNAIVEVLDLNPVESTNTVAVLAILRMSMCRLYAGCSKFHINKNGHKCSCRGMGVQILLFRKLIDRITRFPNIQCPIPVQEKVKPIIL